MLRELPLHFPHALRQPGLSAWCYLSIALSLTFLLWCSERRHVEKNLRLQLELEAAVVRDEVQGCIDAYLDSLRATQGLF
jgi:hypothetical protein